MKSGLGSSPDQATMSSSHARGQPDEASRVVRTDGATRRSRIVVAAHPDLLDGGDEAFVEVGTPGSTYATFSTVLDPATCVAIDQEAYALARMWYRDDGQQDLSVVDGVSLGRAFELRGTAIGVLVLRARTVLERLVGRDDDRWLELRGVGAEWKAAADTLGLHVSGSAATDALVAHVPDAGLDSPPAYLPWLRRFARLRGVPGRDHVTMIETPRWADAYREAVSSRWPARLVNPGRRAVAQAALGRNRVDLRWLAEYVGGSSDAAAVTVPGSADRRVGAVMADAFRRQAPLLAQAAAAGRALSGCVAIASQDVAPSVRACLLGMKAAGVPVLTLEHGISGGYVEQVHSVADVLGVWGPLQASYHRGAGPQGLRIEELGWPRLERARRSRYGPTDLDVVYFAQPSVPLSAGSWPEDPLRAHHLVEAYAVARPNRRVAAKLHPAMSAYMSGLPGHREVPLLRGDSLAAIGRARVVVTMRSTTALEAMAIGRPVVLIEPLGRIGPNDLLDGAESVARARSIQELEDSIERFLEDEKARTLAIEGGLAFARSFVRGLEVRGGAVDRLVGLVDHLRQHAPDALQASA